MSDRQEQANLHEARKHNLATAWERLMGAMADYSLGSRFKVQGSKPVINFVLANSINSPASKSTHQQINESTHLRPTATATAYYSFLIMALFER